MVLSRKGRERALMGRRRGGDPDAPGWGPAGARCLPESRRRKRRVHGPIPPRRSPRDRRVPAGIVDDGAPPLRGSAGFRNGRGRASRGPARTPALPGEPRARTGRHRRARPRPVIPERPRPGRPPAPHPANPAIPDPGTTPTRRPARLSRNSRSAPVPERPPAPRPANPASANPAIPDPGTAPARRPASQANSGGGPWSSYAGQPFSL